MCTTRIGFGGGIHVFLDHSYARNDRPGLHSTHSVIFVQGVGAKTGLNNLPHYPELGNDSTLPLS
jgi:hypothetical protein